MYVIYCLGHSLQQATQNSSHKPVTKCIHMLASVLQSWNIEAIQKYGKVTYINLLIFSIT